MTNLVTVTCSRDINQLILQCHSIDVFVEKPCTHHIFIEDTFDDEKLFDLISKFYTRHKLVIHRTEKIDLNGWYRQQLIKLKAVNVINDDYLLLDSKNFFIKPTDLEYNLPEGNWYLLKNTDWVDPFIKFLRDRHNINVPEHYYTQHTPFKIRKDIALNILKLFDIETMFQQCAVERVYPSEFVLYTVASDIRPTYESWSEYSCNPKYHTWWWNDDIKPDEFENIYNSSVEILGLHKNLWYHKNDKIKLLAQWLCTKGLETEFVFPATLDMDWGETYLQDRPITSPHAS